MHIGMSSPVLSRAALARTHAVLGGKDSMSTVAGAVSHDDAVVPKLWRGDPLSSNVHIVRGRSWRSLPYTQIFFFIFSSSRVCE